MRILNLLYFYEPYTSGLTIYAARIANGLVERGHDVSVVSGQYDPSLPRKETNAAGVKITRVPVAAHFDRAIIMPTFVPEAIKAMRDADVVHLHTPMAESVVLALAARAMGKRLVVTCLSDLVLDASPLTKFAAESAKWSGIAAGYLAHSFVALTESRAKVSPTASKMSRNLMVIPPPIIAPPAPADARETFRKERGWGDRPVVGFVGRYTSEKGIDRLLASIAKVRETYPDVLYALVGPIRDPRTQQPYEGPWDPYLTEFADNIDRLDRISDDDLARFYTAIDVLTLPSVDWTETFGMVQVEAMLRGTPVIASDMPGVNEPVTVTGAGKLIRPGNVDDLASAVVEVLGNRDAFRPDIGQVAARYSMDTTLDLYERAYGKRGRS